MNDNILQISLFLQLSVQLGTPLLLATLGGILCEKAGNLNLGIEGMMLVGAAMGFRIGYTTGNPFMAVAAAGVAGILCALIYGFITVTLRGNQVVTGLVLTIFGTGFSGFLGLEMLGAVLPVQISRTFAAVNIPLLSQIPIIGKMLFSQSIYIYFSLIAAILLYLYIKRTRPGLNLRAVGENPAAADASGISVTLYKYLHIMACGFFCGIAGAYLSLVFVPRWQESITAGAGWIAVALIIFATWNPLRAVFGAYLFGSLQALSYKLQGMVIPLGTWDLSVSSQFLSMLPYLMTIIVLVFITLQKKRENMAPTGLGQPYFREER